MSVAEASQGYAGSIMSVTVPDDASTKALASALATKCRAGDCILLAGDLGAGKTTFARGFIQALQPEAEEVVSPTFTLVQTYPARDGVAIWHFDLYRLRVAGEAAELGLEEALDSGITLIEWPEIIRHELPGTALEVSIRQGKTAAQRVIEFAGNAATWQDRLRDMKGLGT